MEDYPHAIEYEEKARALWERTLGPDDPKIANALDNLGDTYAVQRDYVRSADAFRRAIAIQEKALGLDAPPLVVAFGGLGWATYRLGHAAAAVPLFERALAVCHDVGELARSVGESQCGLARALWDSGGDRGRAVTMLGRSLGSLASAVEPEAKKLAAECRAWLGARR
jgi:tetratricopeptide (TPR) repeat protein